jgi:hypothetical protein
VGIDGLTPNSIVLVTPFALSVESGMFEVASHFDGTVAVS